MKKQLFFLLALVLLAMMIFSACGSSVPAATKSPTRTKTTQATEPAPPTSTPDPCAPENLPAEVEKVHKLMREFDDASLLASNTPIEQLNPSIADLQRIRRDAEDQPVPSCLTSLKQYQLAHMNTVINTMLYMLGYQGNDSEKEVLLALRARNAQERESFVRPGGLG